MSNSCSPRVNLSHMDVCPKLKLQSVATLQYKLYMIVIGKGLGTELGRGSGQNQPQTLDSCQDSSLK